MIFATTSKRRDNTFENMDTSENQQNKIKSCFELNLYSAKRRQIFYTIVITLSKIAACPLLINKNNHQVVNFSSYHFMI